MKPEDLIPTIQDCFGEHLQSIVLYGSAASGQYHEKHSDFNLLVLVQKALKANPLAGQKILKKWLKKNPPPLVWEVASFQSAVDVFPLEFLEVKEHHKILYGKPLPPFKVDLKNLRHQCEMELRSKYLQLQNHPAYLQGDPKLLFQTILRSLSSIMALIKGILLLLKKNPEHDWEKRIEQLALYVDIHPNVFLDLTAIRKGKNTAPRKEEVGEIFEAYLTELKTMISFVNSLEGL